MGRLAKQSAIKAPTEPLPDPRSWPRPAQEALVNLIKADMPPLAPDKLDKAVTQQGVTIDDLDAALQPLGLQLDRQRTGFGVLILTRHTRQFEEILRTPVPD